MEPRLLDIFVESTRSVLEALGLAPLTVGSVEVGPSHRMDGELMTRIALNGDNTVGNMVVGFERGTALAVAAALLGETQTELNDDVLSVVGEVTNMVCGDAKRRLSEMGIAVGMARPELLTAGTPAPLIAGDGEVAIFPCTSAGGAFYVSVDFGLVSPS
jgi:chemotaxis protein CheX